MPIKLTLPSSVQSPPSIHLPSRDRRCDNLQDCLSLDLALVSLPISHLRRGNNTQPVPRQFISRPFLDSLQELVHPCKTHTEPCFHVMIIPRLIALHCILASHIVLVPNPFYRGNEALITLGLVNLSEIVIAAMGNF